MSVALKGERALELSTTPERIWSVREEDHKGALRRCRLRSTFDLWGINAEPPLSWRPFTLSICCFALAAGAFAWMFWWVERQKK